MAVMPSSMEPTADEPSTLTPPVIETMHATGEARGMASKTRAMEPTADEPSTLMPPVIGTMHVTGEA